MRPTDLTSLARFILSEQCKSIAILTGAGVSVAAGIPDFRSPGGLYDTLQPDRITATAAQRAAARRDPMCVVYKDMFFQNSFPYLEVRRPFILGTRENKWKATLSHRFFELLHTKTGKLTRLYTQNIDGLDFQCTQLPSEKIVPVHGSIGRVACEGCGASADFGTFCDAVSSNIKDLFHVDPTAPTESSPIPCAACGKPLVKPTTVLFGSNLPEDFFRHATEDMPTLDLLIVAGTSLVVSPANSLVYKASKSAVRLIVNDQPVGEELGIEYGPDAARDLFAQGDADQVFLELMDHLGWVDELDSRWAELPEQSQERLRQFHNLRSSSKKGEIAAA